MLPTKFRFILPNGCRAEESKKSANQKQEFFLCGKGDNSNLDIDTMN
jgi:hypothetical protein